MLFPKKKRFDSTLGTKCPVDERIRRESRGPCPRKSKKFECMDLSAGSSTWGRPRGVRLFARLSTCRSFVRSVVHVAFVCSLDVRQLRLRYTRVVGSYGQALVVRDDTHTQTTVEGGFTCDCLNIEYPVHTDEMSVDGFIRVECEWTWRSLPRLARPRTSRRGRVYPRPPRPHPAPTP